MTKPARAVKARALPWTRWGHGPQTPNYWTGTVWEAARTTIQGLGPEAPVGSRGKAPGP